jgi:threonine synthase
MKASGKFTLDCAFCHRRQEASYPGRRCAGCDGPLVVRLDLAGLQVEATARRKRLPREPDLPGMWKYFPMLPLTERSAIVSLAEGGTPLLGAGRLAEMLGLRDLTLKDETRNPTGSFKDRMLAVGIARARELGKTTVAVQSSGNVAAAAAAYAAKAGLEAKVFVPRTVPEEKLLQIRMYGADLFRIDHPSPTAVFELLRQASEALGWYIVSTTALYNPFVLEGAKTIAYELAEQTDFNPPEWLIVPVGGGGNLGTLWRAFQEMKELGLVRRLPRLVGAQAAGCAPFVEAVREGLTAQEAARRRWPEIQTICGAIADDVVFDAHLALPAVRESGGRALAVSDEDTLAMEQLLATTEALFVEPSSATGLAALRRLVAEGVVERESSVCCLLTGAGLKDPGSAKKLLAPAELLPATPEAVLARAREVEAQSSKAKNYAP